MVNVLVSVLPGDAAGDVRWKWREEVMEGEENGVIIVFGLGFKMDGREGPSDTYGYLDGSGGTGGHEREREREEGMVEGRGGGGWRGECESGWRGSNHYVTWLRQRDLLLARESLAPLPSFLRSALLSFAPLPPNRPSSASRLEVKKYPT